MQIVENFFKIRVKLTKKIIIFLFIFAFLIIFKREFCYATDSRYQLSFNNYKLTNYEVNINVKEDYTLDITEQITAYFDAPRHGIYRDIPLSGRIKDISVIDGATLEDVPYMLSTVDGNLRIKIGSSDNKLMGEKTYVIGYSYLLSKDRSSIYDQLYFNIIGTGWDTTIGNVNFSVQMPKNFNKEDLKLMSGLQGYTSNNSIKYDVHDNKITGSLEGILQPQEGLTIMLKLPEGYFKAVYPPKGIIYIVLFTVFMVISLLMYLIYGWQKLKHSTVENSLPEDLNPAEVSFIFNNGGVNLKGIIAMIPYWANKGYLTIENNMGKGLILLKQREADDEMKAYEKLLFNKLFENRFLVSTTDLGSDFYTTVSAVKSEINKSFYEPSSRKAQKSKLIGCGLSGLCFSLLVYNGISQSCYTIGYYVLAVITAFACLMYSLLYSVLLEYFIKKVKWGYWKGAAVCICSYISLSILLALFMASETNQKTLCYYGIFSTVVCCLCGVLSNKRTDLEEKLTTKLIGFKKFIQQSEKEEIQKLVNINPKLVYNYLPYAYVFNLYKGWTDSFNKIKIELPDWFHGTDSGNYTPLFFLESFYNELNNYESSLKSYDSSSSSDGGSVGGGDGGGGGGSW
jgi:uncharacterized membrane protein YgcG